MSIDNFNTIGITGSGTMGRGISICCALSGYNTIIYDITDEILAASRTLIEKELSKSASKNKITAQQKNDALSLLNFTSDFSELKKCQFVIEAAPEDINLKQEIFEKLNDTCSDETIFATNTSSFSVTMISTFVKNNPSRVAGMHFFNPANIMKLVEVIKGKFTSDSAISDINDLCVKLGKVPVSAKDTPAFIVNRIARPFYGEALRILGEGTADVSAIDLVLKNCGGFAMGPFELMDLIGIDINFSVTKSVFDAFFFDSKYRPSFIQKQMVDANLLGRKTGKGFYEYK